MAAEWMMIGAAVSKVVLRLYGEANAADEVGDVISILDRVRVPGRRRTELQSLISDSVRDRFEKYRGTHPPADAEMVAALNTAETLVAGLVDRPDILLEALRQPNFSDRLVEQLEQRRDKDFDDRAKPLFNAIVRAAGDQIAELATTSPRALSAGMATALRQLDRMEPVLDRVDANVNALVAQQDASRRELAAASAHALLELKPGTGQAALEKLIGNADPIDWGQSARIVFDGKKLKAQRILYILPAVYVEAFITKGGIVRAMTVTARTRAETPVGLARSNVILNRTTLVETPLVWSTGENMADLIVDAYQRSGALWEVAVGDNKGAAMYTTRCVGWTSVGASPAGSYDTYLQARSILLKRAATPIRGSHNSYPVWDSYEAELAKPRNDLVINAIAGTSRGVDWFPELISLHIETIVELDTDRSWTD